MKTCPPPPRSSAIGPLGTTSYVERSVTCLHCQKVHDRGFIWKFSDEVSVCFTCYRVMGEDGRKSYERKAAKSKSKQQPEPQLTVPQVRESSAIASKETNSNGGGSTMKILALLALLIVVLGGATTYFLYQPLTAQPPEHRLWARAGRIPVNRQAQ
jgi:hypothetical protein